MSCACFFGVDSSDHLGVVVKGLLGLEGSLVSSDTLADNFGVLVDPDVRCCREKVFANFA